ncbi:MAG TPA: c-type cytochrome [Gemmataceae bacterium]|nr:c-type cytochrome [Gemmataceae bacterium]
MLDCSRRHPSRSFLFLLFTLTLLHTPANTPAAEKAKQDGHPIVPGFERFHAGGTDAVKGGRLLLGELNCISCHKPENGQEASGVAPAPRVLQRKQAPILDRVGERVRRSYLRKFLRDPRAIKPGTTMPNLFAAVPEAERDEKIEALVHFLAATGTLKRERADTKAAATGQQLYHQVGCVACHGSRDNNGDADKLLATSVPLGDLRTKYSIHSLTVFLEKPHAVRPSGRMPGILNNQEAKQVANYLLRGQSLAQLPANMSYAYYEGTWDKLPSFANLKPRATGKAPGFDLSLAQRPGNFALRFEGYLRIDRGGDYRFHLHSDDGSKLFLDDKLAVVNDGVHPPSTVSQAVKLTKGTHKLTAGVFNAGGGVELHVDIEGPGLGRQDLAPLVTLTPEGNPKPTVKPVDPNEEDDFALKPELAAKGRELFASVGCASCHPLSDGGKAIASNLKASPLDKLGGTSGCLATEPAKGLPHYALNTAQRGALAAAIKAPAAATKPAVEEIIARTMTTLNCYACHERGKVGGVEQGVNALFITTQPEMGEEGRLPPPLNDPGAKLKADYLKQIFNQGAHDRPYMLTRMPRFGEANVPGLIEAFATADKGKVEPVAKVTFTHSLRRAKSEARKMCGGGSLGCVKCHTFAGNKAEGVQGIDMLLMPKRLHHDWFYRYLLDPQKLRPGTRMPTAWTNGMTVLPDVLDGSTAQQIESIWLYLQDGGKAALPPGLRKHSIPLEVGKEAIIYRNFIEGSGSRAIGVGYPEKANLSFDANDLRLALLWQGEFIDAGRHWNDRGVGFEPPLGENVIHLPAGVAFAVLAKHDETWPTKSGKDLGYQFHGYRTTPDGRPTFSYSCRGARVEDFPNAVAGKSSSSIRRALTLTSDKPVANLWFRAAVADKIEPAAAKGSYRINGEWTLKLDAGAEAKVRKSGGKTELLVPLRFQDGKARIVEEFVW